MTEPWDDPSPWASDTRPAPGLIGQTPTSSLPDATSPLSDISGDGPQVAYLPAHRFRPGDDAIRFELRLFADGRSALLAYSSLELLVAGCGEAQPWVAVRLAADDLAELARLCGADEALWDVNIPVEARHGAETAADPKDSGEVP